MSLTVVVVVVVVVFDAYFGSKDALMPSLCCMSRRQTATTI
jgi:hypothetical protein